MLARGFQRGSTAGMRYLFVRCAKVLRAGADDPGFRDLVLFAMAESWGRAAELVDVSASLLHANAVIARCVDRVKKAGPRRLTIEELFGPDLAAVAQSRLLRCLLESTPVTDVRLE